MLNRRRVMGLAAAALSVSALPTVAALPPTNPTEVMTQWYRLVLELIRHTATQTPPVASRAMAYLGVTIYESLATGNPAMTTLAGQLNDLTPVPVRPDALHDEALVVHGAMAATIHHFFGNTGPTGQRAIKAVERQLTKALTEGHPVDVVDRSLACGQAVAAHIIAWAATDGGANCRKHGLSAELDADRRPLALGADQQGGATTGAAATRMGPQPHLRDAERHGRGLRPARAAGL